MDPVISPPEHQETRSERQGRTRLGILTPPIIHAWSRPSVCIGQGCPAYSSRLLAGRVLLRSLRFCERGSGIPPDHRPSRLGIDWCSTPAASRIAGKGATVHNQGPGGSDRAFHGRRRPAGTSPSAVRPSWVGPFGVAPASLPVLLDACLIVACSRGRFDAVASLSRNAAAASQPLASVKRLYPVCSGNRVASPASSHALRKTYTVAMPSP